MRENLSKYFERQIYERSLKSEPSIVKLIENNVPVNSKTAHPPPPGQTLGNLTFLKNFGQIPRYVACFDGQMPHPLEIQRRSNPPPCHAMHT